MACVCAIRCLGFRLNKNFLGIRIISFPENRFLCHAINVGVKNTKAPYICIMANDMLAGPGVFSKIVNELETNPKTGGASPQCIEKNDNPRTYHAILATKDHTKNLYNIEKRLPKNKEPIKMWHNSAFQIITRELWDKVGEFDDGMRTHCMDNDFGMRMELNGYTPKCFRDMWAFHYGSFGRFSLKKEPLHAKRDTRYFRMKWGIVPGQPMSLLYPNAVEKAKHGNFVSNKQKNGRFYKD